MSPTHRAAAALVLVLYFCGVATLATQITLPYVFTAGTIASPSQVNSNFNTIVGVVNGNLDNGNIAATAAIAPTKLDTTAQIWQKNATTTKELFSASIPTDAVPRISIEADGSMHWGAGGSAPYDLKLKRNDANSWAFRDEGDTVYKDLYFGNGTLSGALSVGTTLGVTGAVTLTTALTAANGGTGRSTLTSNAVLTGNGTGTVNLVTIGSANQLLSVNGAGNGYSFIDQTSVATNIFGGNGSFGAAVASSDLKSGAPLSCTTLTSNGGSSVAIRNTVINATGNITIGPTASSGITANSQGWTARVGQATASSSGSNGIGICAGFGGTGSIAGGGGGGYGAGGDGGGASATTLAGKGGASGALRAWTGSSGGCGATGAGGTSGNSGAGGDVITICTRGTLTVNASCFLQCDGGAAAASTSVGQGSGGGGAGTIFFYSNQSSAITNSGTVSCDGGAGAAHNGGTNGGGGGGGGYILEMYPNAVAVGAIGTVAGGAGNGTGSAGSAGLINTVSGTPSFAIVSYHYDGRGLRAQNSIILAKRWLQGVDITRHENRRVGLTARENAQFMSAWYCKPGQFQNLCMAMLYGDDGSAAELSAVDVHAAFEHNHGNPFESQPVLYENSCDSTDELRPAA